MYSSCFPLSCLGLYIHVYVLAFTKSHNYHVLLNCLTFPFHSLMLLGEARKPFCFLFHIPERPRLAVGVGVHPQASGAPGIGRQYLYETRKRQQRVLFNVNGIGPGSAKSITCRLRGRGTRKKLTRGTIRPMRDRPSTFLADTRLFGSSSQRLLV